MVKKEEAKIIGYTKKSIPIIDVPTTVKIYNGKTGQVYNNKSAVKADIDDTKTETTSKDIKQDVTIEVPRLPDLINRTLQRK